MSSKERETEIPEIYVEIFEKWGRNTYKLIKKMLKDIDHYSLKINPNQIIFSLICTIYDFEQGNKKEYDKIEKYINSYNIIAKKLHEREDAQKRLKK